MPYYADYEEIFTSEDAAFGGGGALNGTVSARREDMHGERFAVSVKIAPMSIMFFRAKNIKDYDAIMRAEEEKKAAKAKKEAEKKAKKEAEKKAAAKAKKSEKPKKDETKAKSAKKSAAKSEKADAKVKTEKPVEKKKTAKSKTETKPKAKKTVKK